MSAGGSESVWRRLARVCRSAGFVALPGPVGVGVPATPRGPVMPRWAAGRPSVGLVVEWGRQAGPPAEWTDRVAWIARAYGWGDTP